MYPVWEKITKNPAISELVTKVTASRDYKNGQLQALEKED